MGNSLIPLWWSKFLALFGDSSLLAALRFRGLRLFSLSIVFVNIFLWGDFLAALGLWRLELFNVVLVNFFLWSYLLATLGFGGLGLRNLVLVKLFLRRCLLAACLLGGGSLIFGGLLLGPPSLSIGFRNFGLLLILIL